MQDREYLYARRVWRRSADGGCYALSMPCRHPAAPLSPGSAVHVTDHASGFRIRAVPSAQGCRAGVRTFLRRSICACQLSTAVSSCAALARQCMNAFATPSKFCVAGDVHPPMYHSLT